MLNLQRPSAARAALLLTLLMAAAGGVRAQDPLPHPGLYPARAANGNWGFIDATGQFRIAPVYTDAADFSDGVAYVYRYIGDRRVNGIVDTNGKFTALPTNDYEVTFAEGLARFSGLSGVERAYGYLDKTGRVIIAARFWDAGPFSEGLAWVSEWHDRKLLYGFIDRTGKYVIPLRFTEQPGDFSGGYAWVQTETDNAFIDRTGKVLFAGKYSWLDHSFSEGLLAVVTAGDSPHGMYLDRNGREVLTVPAWNERTALQHAAAGQSWRQMSAPFQEGLAPYRSFNKVGFIDRTGKIVIPAQFRETEGFAGGLAAVKVAGGNSDYVWGYIDRAGEMVVQPAYREAKPFAGPLARVVTEAGVDELIDRTGKVVWPTGKR